MVHQHSHERKSTMIPTGPLPYGGALITFMIDDERPASVVDGSTGWDPHPCNER
jgi:hypothetical protein